MWSGIKCGMAACVVYVFSRGKRANWSAAFLFLITFLFPSQASLFCMLTRVPLKGEFNRLMNRAGMFKNKPKFCNETFLKEPSCYRDFCKDAVLHLSLLKRKIFISWAKWGVSYPSFGACSMTSGWTSHYKTLLLIPLLHKASLLNFSACGLYLGFHSWELKVPKLQQHGSETLRGFSFGHHQANKTFTSQNLP